MIYPRLIYGIYHGKFLDALISLVQTILSFTARTSEATHIVAHQSDSIPILLMKRKSHLGKFLPRTTALRKQLPNACFLSHYNLNLFNACVQPFVFPTYLQKVLTVTLERKWLLGRLQGELHCKEKYAVSLQDVDEHGSIKLPLHCSRYLLFS